MPYVVTLSKIAPTEKDVEHLIRKGTLTRKEVNLIKSGKTKAVRISSINTICEAERCQPGDLFEYDKQEKQIGRA